MTNLQVFVENQLTNLIITQQIIDIIVKLRKFDNFALKLRVHRKQLFVSRL